ncbi:type IV secretory system conjugative DNA transfer family protein [Picrophilus oshimae]|uniref:Hypothetical membrane protein n=1 Tax=Picrophilus torridus (strain ATCC 700027 / DSM 9790 / JCM 10055 / NBRC 100828 / KAW 2/3) TaxID=1122961 RepID=Q6L0L3_PICTO|nr:type IV secretory system conjugative DNA transfer family protein [Picrophilus oshimae]AAT43489.1 hypothetical membrane protein [Picrophilus oshimae DSM 9789]SMD30202.1 hypothetical protein SAMN02745355_0065 [Picrophilus oshimae DSM 9789]
MRIPVNVHNFKLKIFRLDAQDFIILFLSLCLLIFMVSISVNLLIPGLAIFLIIIFLLKSRKLISVIISRTENNDLLYFYIEYNNSFYNIDKNEKFIEISRELNTIDCISFILEPYIDGDSYYYRLIIGLRKDDLKKISSFKILQEKSIKIRSPDLIKRRYYVNDSYRSVFYLYDANYGSDLLYASFIYSLNIPVEIFINAVPVEKDTIKKMLVTRKAELKRLRHHGIISRQINDLNNFINSDNKIFDVSLKFIVSGRDPLDLRKNSDKFKNVMERLGFNIKNLDYYNKRSVSPNYIPYRYMMDSISLASIIPNNISKGSGVLIGTDKLNNRPFFLDVFNGISYNTIIAGQTGSGKTFLASRFIEYYKNSAFIYIIDPLDEYHFDGSAVFAVNDIKGLSKSYNHINIIKTGYNINDELLNNILNYLEDLCRDRSGKKIIIIDEAYNIIKSEIKAVDNLIRNARHYSTSIINISQNFSDFSKRFSIVNNSDNIFLFRQKEKIELMNMTIDCSGLAGGNNNNYSECILVKNREIIKLTI